MLLYIINCFIIVLIQVNSINFSLSTSSKTYQLPAIHKLIKSQEKLDYIVIINKITITQIFLKNSQINEQINFFIASNIINNKFQFTLICEESTYTINAIYNYQIISPTQNIISYIETISITNQNQYEESIIIQIPINNYQDVDIEVFLLGFAVTNFKSNLSLEIMKNEFFFSQIKVYLKKELNIQISSIQLQIIITQKQLLKQMTYQIFSILQEIPSIDAIICNNSDSDFNLEAGLKGFSQNLNSSTFFIEIPTFKKNNFLYTSSQISNFFKNIFFQILQQK